MNVAQTTPDRRRTVLMQLVALFVLCGVAFRSELGWALHYALSEREGIHFLLAPIFIVLVIRPRRHLITLDDGNWISGVIGMVLIVLSFAVVAGSIWLNYGLPARVALVPALIGCILAVAGCRTLWHLGPALLMLFVTMPIETRHFKFVIIHLQKLTLQLDRALLEMLPGVHMVNMTGVDMSFIADAGSGSIALGETHRAVAIPFACLTLIVLVAFARIRPVAHTIVLAVLAGPMVIIANFLRVFTWGLMSIYGGVAPTSPAPRLVAPTVCIISAYVMVITVCGILNGLMRPPEATAEPEAHP